VARDCLHVDPDPWQCEIINARGEQRLILASRQSGKSWTTAVRATHEALYHAPAMILVASPSESQSKELFRKITGFLGDIPDAPKATRRNETELELDNGSRLVAVPGSERTIRSKSAVNLLVIDEASRIEDALISAVTPMLATTDGDLIALTTPFGRRGWFWEQWSSGENYQRTKRTALDCPRISQQFLDKERRRLGPTMFSQEYDCEFIDSDSSVFSSELIEMALCDDFEPFLPVAA
jgi:Terminase large subunit, T4likevirus-type, N-terminal